MGAEGLILLDTHVLVWLTVKPHEIGPRTKELIRSATVEEAVLVSPISAWEAAMLWEKGRLDLGRPVKAWVDSVLSRPGIGFVELTPTIAAEAGTLPKPLHGDPADRMIVATARSLGCVLVTADRKILDYAVFGHVQAIDARR